MVIRLNSTARVIDYLDPKMYAPIMRVDNKRIGTHSNQLSHDRKIAFASSGM